MLALNQLVFNSPLTQYFSSLIRHQEESKDMSHSQLTEELSFNVTNNFIATTKEKALNIECLWYA